jgi:hypothetical protein
MNDTAPDTLPPVETVANDLLLAAKDRSPVEIFPLSGSAEELARAKAAADLLTAARFTKFSDDGRTRIEITNAGRYWALHGGFLAYLKEDPMLPARGGRQRNPELEELRMTYMKLRLNTFWWSFGLSIFSLVVSLISLTVAYLYGGILR